MFDVFHGLTLKTSSPLLYHCARKCKINITSILRRQQIIYETTDDRDVSSLLLPTPLFEALIFKLYPFRLPCALME